MKRYIKHLIILAITIASVIPNAFAQVDITRSFYVLRNDSAANGFVEGGEWLIEFSNKDTLGYEYDYPVAMNFKGAYYGDSTFISMQSVDSVQFEQPSTIMKPGVFRLTEEHYQYIVDTDVFKVIRFRIDCISKIDLPKVGQKVISEIYKEPLPLGFLGQVESIKVSYDEGCIVMTCKPIRLSEVYDRLYKVDVLGDDSENDSLPKNVTKSRRLCPLDFDGYDENDQIEIIDKGKEYPFVDVGLILDDKYNFKFSFTPQTASTQMKFYAINNAFHSKSYSATVIDAQNNVNYTEVITEYTLKSTIGAAIDGADDPNSTWNKKYGNVAPLTYRFSPAPKISHTVYGHSGEDPKETKGWVYSLGNPGAYIRLDIGLLVSLAIDATLRAEDTFEMGFKTGYREKGTDVTPIFEKTGKDLVFKNIDFNTAFGGAFVLKGGPYAMVQVGVPGIVELWGEVCAGLYLTGGFDLKSISADESYDAKESTIERLKNKLDLFNKSNYFKAQVGVMFDGRVGLLKGLVLDLPYVNWLKKVPAINNLLNKLMYDIWEYEGVPNYQFTNYSNNNAFSGVFKSNNRFLASHDLYLMLKDADLGSENPNYIDLIRLGEFNLLDGKVEHDFSIPSTDKRNLKGIPLKIYSLIDVNSSGKYCSTGKIADYEFAYGSNISNVSGDDYTFAAIDIEVDPDAVDDEDYTKSGILVWDDYNSEEDGVRIVGNENYPVNATIEFKRKMFSDYRKHGWEDMTYYVKPWVYDAKRDRYVYGEQSQFNLNSLVRPKTQSATSVSYNSAIFNGTINEEFFDYVEQDYDVVFSYWIPGVTAETILKYGSKNYPDILSTLAFDAVVKGLRPNTEYEYRVGIELANKKFYGGEPLKFKTKSPTSNIHSDVGATFGVLYADVQADYLLDGCKNVYFEIVEAKYGSFNDRTQRIKVENYDASINSNGTTTLTAYLTQIFPGTEYLYRLVLVDNSDYIIYSENKSFVTTSVVSNLKAEAGDNFVALSANVDADYLKSECIDVHFEVVNAKQGVFDNTTIKSLDDDESFITNDDGTITIYTVFTNLSTYTNYKYRLVLKTRNGSEVYSEVATFTTASVVSNLKAEAGDDFVALSGNVSADYLKSECIDVHFEVVNAKQGVFDNTTIKSLDDDESFITNDDGTITIYAVFTNLSTETNYKYRLVLKTRNGSEVYSEVGTFTTEKKSLYAETLPAVVEGTSALLSGALSPDLAKLLKEQGVDKVYFTGRQTSNVTGNSDDIFIILDFNGETNFSAQVSNLRPNSTYKYRFYAFDDDGNLYEGNSLTFATSSDDFVVSCTTIDAIVDDAKVQMYGEMSANVRDAIVNGSLKNYQYGFEIAESVGALKGEKPAFAESDKNNIDPVTGVFTLTRVLQPNTTYYIRAMIFVNDLWYSASDYVSVKTADFDPGLIPPDIK